MSGPVEIVLIIAAVAYIMARRLLGELVEAKRVLVLPAVLTVIGLVDVTKVAQSPVSIGFLIATTVISLLLGVLRGASIRVFERDGVAHLKYTVKTLVLWAVNIVVKFGAGFALGVVDPAAEHAVSSGLMLTLGAGMVAEGLVVLARAMGTNGQVAWAKGRDGAPHTMMSLPSKSFLSPAKETPDIVRVDEGYRSANERLPMTGRGRVGDRPRRRNRGR